MHRPWSVLFDIDGTLLLTGGAGTAGMRRALFTLFGADELPEVPVHGRTDFAIMRDYLRALDVPFDRHYHSVRQLYWRELADELAARRGELLPGVLDLLRQLQGDHRFQVGLVTGNGQRAAELKLAAFEIDHHFSFGGFGDWFADRADVARMSWQAARAHVGGNAILPPPVVIGDTPADVMCARAIGASAIAVATGHSDCRELSRTNPDWLVSDLSEVSLDILLDWLESRPH